MADLTIVGSVLTWLEQHPVFAVAADQMPVGLEDPLEDAATSVWLQTLVGEPYIKRYKSGGHIAAHPFAVYVRKQAGDTASRIDAMSLLSDLASSIGDRASWPVAPEGYDYTSLELRTTPAKVAVDDDGTEDYQATFELTYRKRG